MNELCLCVQNAFQRLDNSVGIFVQDRGGKEHRSGLGQ